MLAPPEFKPLRPSRLGFEHILAPVRGHLQALQEELEREVERFEPELRELAGYCIQNAGKRIRPLLVFYAGWEADGKVAPDLVRAAAVVELVHLATLVHDDILDDAEIRHNSSTAAQKYGSSAAVLLGDALFAQALNLASRFPTNEVCRLVSAATRRVCAGEIQQTFSAGNESFSRDDYFRVIELKTAELFRVSCRLGARLAGYPDAYVDGVSEYGRRLGIAYQIFDDMADFYGSEARIGKTLGTDLAKGKYTLPIFILLERLPKTRREDFIQKMQDGGADLDHFTALMGEYEVYEAVMETFRAEIDAGEAAVRDLKETAPLPFLLEMSRAVRQQMARLRTPPASA